MEFGDKKQTAQSLYLYNHGPEMLLEFSQANQCAKTYKGNPLIKNQPLTTF